MLGDTHFTGAGQSYIYRAWSTAIRWIAEGRSTMTSNRRLQPTAARTLGRRR